MSHFSFTSLAHRPKHMSIGDWFRSARGHASNAKHHVGQGVNVVRQGGESLLTGGLLGVVNAKMGLTHGAPVDGLLALFMLGGAVAFAREDYATDMRNIGAASLAVYSFRQGDRLMSESILRSGGVPKGLTAHGENFGADEGDDPILAVARKFRRNG